MRQDNELEFSNGKVIRRYTDEWGNNGIINMDKIPDLVKVLVEQRKNMIEYIENLHNCIDELKASQKGSAGCSFLST